MPPDPERDKLLAANAQLEETIRLLKLSYATPFERLRRLDAALLAGEAAAAADYLALLQRVQFKTLPTLAHVVEFCTSNDLMLAAHRLAEANLALAGRGAANLRLLAKTAEALGDAEASWAAMEEAGDTQGPNERAFFAAMRLRKWAHLDRLLQDPAIRARFHRLLPVLAAARDGAPAAPRPVYVVNVPGDRYRRLRAERNLAELGLTAAFRQGFKPLDVPEADRHLFRIPLTAVTDGSLGNQYSQYRVWREIAEGDAPEALLLEDDSLLLLDPWVALAQVAPPAGWDIIFANPRLDLSRGIEPGLDRFRLDPFPEVLARHSHATPRQGAYGADGYYLSRAGARKLVEIAHSEGFHRMGTDWYLHAHCLPQGQFDAINPDSSMRAGLRHRHGQRFYNPLPLAGYVLSPAPIWGNGVGINRYSRI